jgi:hypothetical protein
MTNYRKLLLIMGLAAMIGGCSHEYSDERPDVQSLSADDRGLQSKDVVQASDQMAMDLLQFPELNDSRTQWTIVVTGVENMTSDYRANYDIFINRLKANLAQQGHGKIQLIQNLDRYRGLQSRELEGGAASASPGMQPQFALTGTVTNLPNRGTDYYLFTFELDDFQTRALVWGPKKYEVKVAR